MQFTTNATTAVQDYFLEPSVSFTVKDFFWLPAS